MTRYTEEQHHVIQVIETALVEATHPDDLRFEVIERIAPRVLDALDKTGFLRDA